MGPRPRVGPETGIEGAGGRAFVGTVFNRLADRWVCGEAREHGLYRCAYQGLRRLPKQLRGGGVRERDPPLLRHAENRLGQTLQCIVDTGVGCVEAYALRVAIPKKIAEESGEPRARRHGSACPRASVTGH